MGHLVVKFGTRILACLYKTSFVTTGANCEVGSIGAKGSSLDGVVRGASGAIGATEAESALSSTDDKEFGGVCFAIGITDRGGATGMRGAFFARGSKVDNGAMGVSAPMLF